MRCRRRRRRPAARGATALIGARSRRPRGRHDRSLRAEALSGALHAQMLGRPVSPVHQGRERAGRSSRPPIIVEVVAGYTSLRKRGATHLGLCPFHQEKTPSFTVSADKGLYYCFGCGEGGDIVRFLEKIENLTFSEAIEQLGERFGVPVKYEEGSGPDAGRKERDSRLLQLLDRTAKFYQHLLWESKEGQGAGTTWRSAGSARPSARPTGWAYSPPDGEGCTPGPPRRGSPSASWRTRVS